MLQATTDGETFQVLERVSAVALLRVGDCPLGKSQGGSGWARFLEPPSSQRNDLIPSLSIYNLCAPSPAQGSSLTLGLLPFPQPHSPQFCLLIFSPFPYSTAQKQVKASFPYLISNVRSLCFNEPSLNAPEDGFWQEQSTSQLKIGTS